MVKGTNSDKVEINYPNSSAGKFVALYGFDMLFKSLPKTIGQLNIKNTSNENIALNVPESLGEFTDLYTLQLVNCVKTLPESIGNCKKLQFLTLTDNPNLTKIPNGIMELPKLDFIALRGCGSNLILPEGFESKFDDMGGNMYYKGEFDIEDLN